MEQKDSRFTEKEMRALGLGRQRPAEPSRPETQNNTGECARSCLLSRLRLVDWLAIVVSIPILYVAMLKLPVDVGAFDGLMHERGDGDIGIGLYSMMLYGGSWLALIVQAPLVIFAKRLPVFLRLFLIAPATVSLLYGAFLLTYGMLSHR